jgi:hypothetical protein
VVHTFFSASGYGDFNNSKNETLLSMFKSEIVKADSNSTVLFLGDNISGEVNDWSEDKKRIDGQLDLTKNFKGETIFIPGNNEWKSSNSDKIEKVEDYLKEIDKDNINVFPENVCPIEHRVINDDLDLILIDSKWFIANWSRIEDINKKCTDITTRRRFAEELEGYINDGQGKNIVIAMHHPVFSNGKYAGKKSFKKSITPLPIVGNIVNGIKDIGAFSPDMLDSRRYTYLRILVTTLAKASDRITVVSGHEESLQYLTGGNIHQVVSGSLANKTPTKRGKDNITTIGGILNYEGKFTHGEQGFVKLEYFDDGSSQVTFYDGEGTKTTMPILEKLESDKEQKNYTVNHNKYETEAILDDKSDLDKSGFYKFLWGDRYRKYFGKEITAPTVLLDTLYGGLKVTKEGGGHQSYSIRLEDENGKEYAMRSLRKNALKFLKFKVKGISYTADDYEDTWTEEAISDFFTTAHPYMQLVINPLARAVDVNHSAPRLFYVPRQTALGDLNGKFGDELYFIEQRPSDEQMNYKGYKRTIDEAGKIEEFESTTDMLEKIKSDESYTVDQRSFARARIFDMLIGDWDRHQDQWRWVEYETTDGNKEFLPVPRDRDNAFPKFDGLAIDFLKIFVPTARMWQSYGPDIKNVKWLNKSGNKLDRAIFTQLDASVWEEEAIHIQQNLTSEKIDAAFKLLPREVQDSAASAIKRNLTQRLQKLPEYAKAYSKYLDKIVAVHATNKDDLIEITRMPDDKTKLVIKRLLTDEKNEVMVERIFDASRTKELWIYGLGDDDQFVVKGEDNNSTFIRLIGGYGKDQYNIVNKKSLKVYDWEHEEITFQGKKPKKQLSDIYETNTYHWRFFKENSNVLRPNLGFRTDDGFYLGASDMYLNNGFNGNPFREKHTLSANYYFDFQAAEIAYQGIFANIFSKWNFEIDGYFTTDKYSTNFFGIGNETENLEDNLGRDFYRARIRQIKLSAGLSYHTLKLKALYESFRTQENSDRFFTPENLGTDLFKSQHYVGGETSLFYYNDDADDYPTKGVYFGMKAGYKINTKLSGYNFGYFSFNASGVHRLIPSGNLTISSTAEVKTNFGGNYFYYHTPSLGGNNGLRGFRDERFSGKTYFYQTSDLRLRVKRFLTPVAPVTMGIYGGFDYGRVWNPNEDSNAWHVSQGGGLWISGFNFLSVNAGYFNSVEGNIIQVGFGWGF